MVSDYGPILLLPALSHAVYCLAQNHSEVTYRGGQEAIVHLEADFAQMVAAAEMHSVRWAVSLSNAAARYASSARALAH